MIKVKNGTKLYVIYLTAKDYTYKYEFSTKNCFFHLVANSLICTFVPTNQVIIVYVTTYHHRCRPRGV